MHVKYFGGLICEVPLYWINSCWAVGSSNGLTVTTTYILPFIACVYNAQRRSRARCKNCGRIWRRCERLIYRCCCSFFSTVVNNAFEQQENNIIHHFVSKSICEKLFDLIQHSCSLQHSDKLTLYDSNSKLASLDAVTNMITEKKDAIIKRYKIFKIADNTNDAFNFRSAIARASSKRNFSSLIGRMRFIFRSLLYS